MSKSNSNFGVFTHEAGQAQHGRGLNPDHCPDLPGRQFQSLLAVWPNRVTLLR